ncbi:MAG: MgtC/SapB family protein [Halohasta sp.]
MDRTIQTGTFFGLSVDEPVIQLAIAALVGLFLGLEREWSDKPAGIRTFSLTCLLGAVFAILARSTPYGTPLVAVGGLFVVAEGVILGVQGLRTLDTEDPESLSLTTSVSLLVSYGVGVLVASEFVLEGVTVAVLSSTLLVLKRELHDFAGGLSRQELRSTIEFAILAFVVYPLLPAGVVDVGPVPFEPRIAWLMVVSVAAIGIVNYALVRSYGGRGIAVTGFFGGLASSAAVVGAMLDYVRHEREAVEYGVAAVLLANAAMALRNLGIAVAFTFSTGAILYGLVVPLGTLVVGSVAVAWLIADWDRPVDMELASPFSLRNALAFGSVFLFILAGSTVAQAEFGTAGLYASALLSGLVSSAGVTTSTVLLFRAGTVGPAETIVAILLATAASVAVKVGLSTAGPRPFARSVARWSGVLLAVTAAVAVGVIVPG